MKILVVADCLDSRVLKTTLNSVQAAREISKDNIQILTYGSESIQKVSGFESIHFENERFDNPTSGSFGGWLYSLIKERGFTHVIASNTSFAKDFLPRVAVLFGCVPVTEITRIESSDTYVRPIYAGALLTKVRSRAPIKFLSVRSASFRSDLKIADGRAKCLISDLATDEISSEFIELIKNDSDRPELGQAKIVISGGKGVGDRFMEILTPLADKLGAAIGASRAAVDEGFAPNDLQVGQTGKVIAPELYICFGISGAAQHLAGIKDAKIVIAVNKDPDAPIHNFADYYLVDDLFKVIPKLLKS